MMTNKMQQEITSLLNELGVKSSRLYQIETKYLKSLKKERGWNQSDIANAIGTSQPFINQVIRGKCHLSTDHWQKLFAVLDRFCPDCGQEMGDTNCPHCGRDRNGTQD